jgi:hypothetical protein
VPTTPPATVMMMSSSVPTTPTTTTTTSATPHVSPQYHQQHSSTCGVSSTSSGIALDFGVPGVPAETPGPSISQRIEQQRDAPLGSDWHPPGLSSASTSSTGRSVFQSDSLSQCGAERLAELVDLPTLESQPPIGQGAFGKVYRCQLYGRDCAVKIVPSHQSQALSSEVKSLSMLRHKNIIAFQKGTWRAGLYCWSLSVNSLSIRSAFQDSERIIIVMEYCPNGTLHQRLHKSSGDIPKGTRARWCREIAEGMAYLQQATKGHVLHRDLKVRTFVFLLFARS